MQGTPPPQQIIGQPSKVAAKHGDGPEIWSQIPNQNQYQIPIQPGMAMGYYPTTNATLALVLSVLGIVGCSILTAIPGLIMANSNYELNARTPRCRNCKSRPSHRLDFHRFSDIRLVVLWRHGRYMGGIRWFW
jgi:hypothetical protein